MLKFIHQDFELDLTYLKVTFNWKNIWFQSDIDSEFSFPFDIPENIWSKIDNFGSFNSISNSRVFEGKMYRDGELKSAKLKLQEKKGKNISALIFAGYESFPSGNKKLSQLNLLQLNVVDIKAHALTIKGQGYPDVNYNFCMVHSDSYDSESAEFNNFKAINYFKDGAYVVNSLEAGTNIDQIENIMQPLPYLMYVLNQGFADAGYILQGDVLTIEDLKKALLFKDGKYFTSVTKDKIPFHFKNSEWDSGGVIQNTFEKVTYNKTLNIAKKGVYVLLGDLYIASKKWIRTQGTGAIGGQRTSYSVLIKVNAANVFSLSIPTTVPDAGSTIFVYDYLRKISIDLNLDLNVGDVVTLTVVELRRDIVPTPTPDYPEMSALDLIPLRFKNPDNSPIVSLQDVNEINLTKVVPDVDFIDLVNSVRISENLGIEIQDNIVTMNFINLEKSTATDLSKYDIEEPLETFNDERTYEMKYTEGDNEKVKYDKLFVQSSGNVLNDYTIENSTTQINFDLLPLPMLNRHSINTAFAYDSSESLRIVFYDHLADSDAPSCYENNNYKIENRYLLRYKNWLDFLLYSITYKWDFIVNSEQFKEILKSNLIYGFKNYHVLAELEREKLNYMYWRITATTEKLT